MNSNSLRQVLAFPGPRYDSSYCGWLFDDPENEDRLRSLFQKNPDPINLSFVTPMATSVDEGINGNWGLTKPAH